MTLADLRHVHRFKDRHGKVRHYLRLPGRRAVALPGEPGSAAFLAAYQAAMVAPAPAISNKAPTPGTFDALCASYYRSPQFLGLKATTGHAYRLVLEEVRAKHGDKPIALLSPGVTRGLMAEKASAPGAANNRLRVLRSMARHAVAAELLPADFTAGVRKARLVDKGGFHTWTEDEIAQFEARWPSGSKPRLALALLLYTGQRRGDVITMGRQSIQAGRIEVRQQKTGARLLLPIHPTLAAELAHVPAEQLLFLMSRDRSYSANGFYQQFKAWAEAAGLPHWSPHGGRKACARRLAEAGATTREIMAMTGHASLAEAERYTRAVDQARLAESAMGRIVPLSPLPARKPKSNGKPGLQVSGRKVAD